MFWTVAKEVFLGGVSVKVKEEIYFFLEVLELFEEVDETSNFRVQKVTNIIETPVEVPAAEAGPVVAGDDPIGVDHRDDMEVEG